jgi:hypothetical protein
VADSRGLPFQRVASIKTGIDSLGDPIAGPRWCSREFQSTIQLLNSGHPMLRISANSPTGTLARSGRGENTIGEQSPNEILEAMRQVARNTDDAAQSLRELVAGIANQSDLLNRRFE